MLECGALIMSQQRLLTPRTNHQQPCGVGTSSPSRSRRLQPRGGRGGQGGFSRAYFMLLFHNTEANPPTGRQRLGFISIYARRPFCCTACGCREHSQGTCPALTCCHSLASKPWSRGQRGRHQQASPGESGSPNLVPFCKSPRTVGAAGL